MRALAPDCIVADSMALWGKLIAKKLDIPFVSSTTTFAFNRYSAKIMKQSPAQLFGMLVSMPKIGRGNQAPASGGLSGQERAGYHSKRRKPGYDCLYLARISAVRRHVSRRALCFRRPRPSARRKCVWRSPRSRLSTSRWAQLSTISLRFTSNASPHWRTAPAASSSPSANR